MQTKRLEIKNCRSIRDPELQAGQVNLIVMEKALRNTARRVRFGSDHNGAT